MANKECSKRIDMSKESSIKNKKAILEAIKILVQEGELIASGNDNNFSEFAEVNNFDLETVKEVMSENEEYIESIFIPK